MSYYTTIYPDWDFRKEFADKQTLENAKYEIIEKSNDVWGEIYGLIFSIPTEHHHGDIERTFWNYVQLQKEDYRLFAIGEMMDCIEYNEKPSISVNKYEYNYDPKDGIRESDITISQVRMKLIGLAMTTPSEITPKGQDPMDYLCELIRDLRQELDYAIIDKEFSELCVKYWDTHEEG